MQKKYNSDGSNSGHNLYRYYLISNQITRFLQASNIHLPLCTAMITTQVQFIKVIHSSVSGISGNLETRTLLPVR